MKTILVTGCAGFIGSHTAELFLKLGNRVIGLDNLAPTYSIEIKRRNLEQVRAHASNPENFIFIEGNIRNSNIVENALKAHHPDLIVHLAALAGVQPSIKNPSEYMEVNVTGTVNLLESAHKLGIKNFILASSSSVYGTNSKVPFSEADRVNHPISPYAASKRSCELLAYTYSHLYQMKIACLRFFTVYGPRQRPDLAIYKFTQAILNDQLIQIYGDGTSQRDYTYISDIVEGIGLTSEWIQSEKAERNRFEIFNLGESQTVPLNQLVSLLEKTLNKKAKVEHAPYLPGDVPITYADLAHSKEILGYQPKVKIEEGINKFCDWYLNQK